MNGELYEVSCEWMLGQIEVPEEEERTHLTRFGNLSTHIICGLYKSTPLCFIGIIPRTVLADEAYIWLYVTPAGEAHRYLLAKYSRAVINRILQFYTKIIGHCITQNAMVWLSWLGADFIPGINGSMQFEIRRD